MSHSNHAAAPTPSLPRLSISASKQTLAPLSNRAPFANAPTTQLHVSPHGTVRSIRSQVADGHTTFQSPSARLPLGGTLPSGAAPPPISLPESAPLKSGQVSVVDGQPLVVWDLGPINRMRPVNFKANGSFKTLADTGKLGRSSTAEMQRPHPLRLEKDSYIPGYTFIRGKQHIAGRTYGETTRRALSREFREITCSSPIPSGPHANRKISQVVPQDSFVTNTFHGKNYHIPGYTGFVPGVRNTFAMSYGASTSQELEKHLHTTRGGVRTRSSKDGFADTARARHVYVIDSAPLPGAVKTNKPPQKLIPNHLRDIRFIGM